MSPVAFVLVIDRGEVAAALELLRRVCDPASKSLPHITVRYSARRPSQTVIDEITRAVIDDLIVTGVETFDSNRDGGVQTVVLGCESDSLEWRSHKPDYPDSYFHITVYDGPKSEFANRVLRVMAKFPWNLRLDSASSHVVEAPRSRHGAQAVALSDRARNLLGEMFPNLADAIALGSLPDDSRLQIVRELCERIHRSAEVSEADRIKPAITSRPMPLESGQTSFWSEDEIAQLSGVPLRAHRRRTGTFLTPPEVAIEVARCALSFSKDGEIRFFDPAIGPGVFFATVREAAKELSRKITTATGIEADYTRATRTATRWRRAGLQVVHGDFLEYEPAQDESWNLLVANPPYIRHQKQAATFQRARARLSAELDVHIDGRADAYIHFVLNAHRLLAEGAVAAWLLPSEFFFTQSGKALRTYLLEKVDLLRVHTFDVRNSVFDHARVTSTVVIYRKSEHRAPILRFSEGGGLAAPLRTSLAPRDDFAEVQRWTALGPPKALHRESMVSLGQYAKVQRGIATGANKLFILDDQDLETHEVRDRWIRPVLPRPRFLRSPRIEADAQGLPLVEPRQWLIDTDERAESIRRSSPVFADYLESIDKLAGGRTLLRERVPFYRQDRRAPAPIVVANMSPADQIGRRFFRNESSAVVLNNYLCIYVNDEKISPDEAFEWLVRHESLIVATAGRVYSSNLAKLEPGDLRQVLLPPP